MGNHQFAAKDITSSPRNLCVSECTALPMVGTIALSEGFAGPMHNSLVPRAVKDESHAYQLPEKQNNLRPI